jgi:hypothetical protein
MTRTLLCAASALLLQTGCSTVDATTFDSTNPVHCMVIFGIAANSARQISQPMVAKQMMRRFSVLADHHGGSAWLAKIDAEALAVAKRMEAANNRKATIQLLEECEAAQDADPRMRAEIRQR